VNEANGTPKGLRRYDVDAVHVPGDGRFEEAFGDAQHRDARQKSNGPRHDGHDALRIDRQDHQLGAPEGLGQARRPQQRDAVQGELEAGMGRAALAGFQQAVIEPRSPQAHVVAPSASDAGDRATHVPGAQDGDVHRVTLLRQKPRDVVIRATP
jgi:hypothetical protein